MPSSILGRLLRRNFENRLSSSDPNRAIDLSVSLSCNLKDDYLLQQFVGRPSIRPTDPNVRLQLFERIISEGYRRRPDAGQAMAIVAFIYQSVEVGDKRHLEKAGRWIDKGFTMIGDIPEQEGYKRGHYYCQFSLLIASIHHSLMIADYGRVESLIEETKKSLGRYLHSPIPQRSWQMFTQPMGVLALDFLADYYINKIDGKGLLLGGSRSQLGGEFLRSAVRAEVKDHFGEKRRTMRFALLMDGAPQDPEDLSFPITWEMLHFICISAFLRVPFESETSKSIDTWLAWKAENVNR